MLFRSVSIIPRGRSLGVTMQLPGEDRHNYSKVFLENNMAVLMGGRVAEQTVLNQLTTGASNDIERATKTAHNMVCLWGMSDKLGPLSYGDSQEQVFLGKELIHNKDYGEETSRLIDIEVRHFVDAALETAIQLVKDNRDALESIAQALLDRETITGADIDLLMKGEPLPPMEPSDSGGGTSGTSSSGGSATGGKSTSGYTAEGKAVDAYATGYTPVKEDKADKDDKDDKDDFILEEDDKSVPTDDDEEKKLQ